MQEVRSDKAPPPGGHYSQAVIHDGIVYVSGQLPIEPATGRRLDAQPVEAQTRQALENLAAVLRASGSDVDRVLKVTVYVADISLWERVNRVYAQFFGNHRPARAVVPTGPLHFGLLVEIEATASVAPL